MLIFFPFLMSIPRAVPRFPCRGARHCLLAAGRPPGVQQLRFILMGLGLAFAINCPAAVWQYSVPVPSIENRRAFLWIPPACPRVRGLVVACQNMLEKPLFERPAFRTACADNGLGILMIFSGHDKGPDDDKNPNHPKRSALDIFLNPNYPNGEEDPKGAGEDLQKALGALADESGYAELRHVPLLPVGHSSAGSFVWHLYRWDPSRIFAMMPFKTGAKDDGPQGIPILDVNSEWFDYGGASNNCSTTPGAMGGVLRSRAGGQLFGYYIDAGSGHCNASDDSINIIGLFLKKAVAARIPADAPLDGPVILKNIPAESGWLLDPATLGKPDVGPVAYADWKGDPNKAFWYLDRELAATVQNHMAAQFAKQPQQIGFIRPDGTISTSGGMYGFSPKFLSDGATFTVDAAFVEHLDKTDLFPPGTKLSHGNTPIYFRVNSGALIQTGSNSFRVCPHAGPLLPQGNPWEPTIVAYTAGDNRFQPTEHPAHVNVSIFNTAGQPQTIDFPGIPDQALGTTSLRLHATASSGLPVEYFVVSGPAESEGDTLKFAPIPVRSKFPVRVLVAAYQWGRSENPQVQSAGPVVREFLIR